MTLFTTHLGLLIGFKTCYRDFTFGPLVATFSNLRRGYFWWAASASSHLEKHFLTVGIKVENIFTKVHLAQRRKLAHQSRTRDSFDFFFIRARGASRTLRVLILVLIEAVFEAIEGITARHAGLK